MAWTGSGLQPARVLNTSYCKELLPKASPKGVTMTSRTGFRSILAGSFALLLCGASAFADSSHARIIRLSLVQGDVRFTPFVKGDPLTSDKATWDRAVVNLPIRQG
jgi:hypothetical protein